MRGDDVAWSRILLKSLDMGWSLHSLPTPTFSSCPLYAWLPLALDESSFPSISRSLSPGSSVSLKIYAQLYATCPL